jgi:hypothetical protein
MVLAEHRLASLIVAAALAATAGVFLFARPQYRPPGGGHQAKPLSYVSPAARGWTWPHGLPGFRIGHDEDRWNMSRIHWRDLTWLRLAARGAGVDPQSLRVLDGARLRPRAKLKVLVAGRDARGRTCIGAQAGAARPAFFCPRQLGGHHVVLIAAPQASYDKSWAIWVNGVVDASVKSITIETKGVTWTDWRSGKPVVHREQPLEIFHREGNHTWGTFTSYHSQPVPWNARLVVYGVHGKLATLPLRFTRPGATVYLR